MSQIEWPQLSNFKIVREIARGGMGVVYEANQLSLGRRVALKTLALDRNLGENAEQRFQLEAQSAAKLHHTNIVPVYEVGQENGCHFYAMQYIEGLGLDQISKRVEELFESTEKSRRRGTAESNKAIASHAGEMETKDALDSETPAGDSLAMSLASSLVFGSSEGQQVGRVVEETTPAPIDSGRVAQRTETSNELLSGETGSFDVDEGLFVGSSSSEVESQLRQSSAVGTTLEETARSLDSRRFREYCSRIAKIGQQVAAGLGYAHQRGVLHRDIKPANLLLDMQGTVWIADFGLAKSNDMDLTKAGGVVGTFRFIAPERFQGRCHESSDIYALGITLYELLACQPAFEAADKAALLDNILTRGPRSLREIEPRVPSDLATIIDKAIEKEPGRRYQSAFDLEDDLLRFLENRPIQAKRISTIGKAIRWCQRNRAIAALLVSLAVGLIALTSVSLVAANSFRKEALVEKARADTELKLRENEEQGRRLAENVRDFIVNSYGNPNLDQDGKTITVYEVLKREVELIPDNFPDDLLTQAVLYQAIGDSFESLSEYSDSIAALEKSLEIFERELGETDRRTIDAMRSLVNVYVSNQQGIESVEFASRLRRLVEENYQDDSELLLDSDNVLGSALFINGEDSKALPVFERVLAQARVVYGNRDQRTLDAMSNLIQSYHWLSKENEERQLADEFLQISLQEFEEDSLEVAKAKEAVAVSLPGEEFERAAELRQAVYDVRLRRLGPMHSESLSALKALAGVKFDAGELAEGFRLRTEHYDRTVEKYGELHRSTAAAATSMGSAYAKTGDDQKAIEWLEKALAIGRQVDPEHDPNLLNTKQGLAFYSYKTGNKHRALELNEDIFRNGYAANGFQVSRVKNALQIMGVIQSELKLREEALATARKFHELMGQVKDPEGYRIVGARAALAWALYELGDFDEALKHAEAAINVELQGEGFPRGVVRSRAIKGLILLGEPDMEAEGEAMLKQALADFENELPKMSLMVRWMAPRMCELAVARFQKLERREKVQEWETELERVRLKVVAVNSGD